MSEAKYIRIWKVSKRSTAGVMITERSASLIGNKNNFVAADETGVSIIGSSINFGVLSENQRHGGFFVKMNDFVQMIPTTLVTPVPNQIPFPPLGLINSVMKDMPFFMAMAAGGLA